VRDPGRRLGEAARGGRRDLKRNGSLGKRPKIERKPAGGGDLDKGKETGEHRVLEMRVTTERAAKWKGESKQPS